MSQYESQSALELTQIFLPHQIQVASWRSNSNAGSCCVWPNISCALFFRYRASQLMEQDRSTFCFHSDYILPVHCQPFGLYQSFSLLSRKFWIYTLHGHMFWSKAWELIERRKTAILFHINQYLSTICDIQCCKKITFGKHYSTRPLHFQLNGAKSIHKWIINHLDHFLRFEFITKEFVTKTIEKWHYLIILW